MANIAMRRFRTGEISPELYGAVDVRAYAEGLRTCKNAYVMRMGGIQSRPGTEYKGTTKSNGAARLVDAVFDETENYVLEFGHQYIRFWRDGAQVSVGTPSAWLTATVYTAGVVRANGGTNYVCILAHTSGGSTEPGVGIDWTTYWYALTGTIFELPTLYQTGQIAALQFQRNYREVTIVHPDHPPRLLTRLGDASWTLATIDFATSSGALDTPVVSLDPDEPGADGVSWVVTAAIYDGATLLSESLPSSPIYTAIASGNESTARTALAASPKVISFDTIDADANLVRIYRNATGTGWRFLTTWDPVSGNFTDDGSRVEGTVTPPTAGPVQTFSSAGEYPGVVGAYQQRLILAGTTNNPDRVYASKTADTDDFGVSDPIVDEDAVSWRQVGQRLNRPRFFAEVASRLVQLTDIGETFIEGSEDNILRPGEVNPRQISYNGIAKDVPPLLVDDTILYAQARGGQVRDLVPFNQEGYSGTEVSRTAQHLVDGHSIVAMAYQKVPHSIAWMVRDDGVVLSLTYVRSEGIFGWAQHDFGGTVESVVVVPEGNEDAVYFVVVRDLESSGRYIERLADRQAVFPILTDSTMTVTLASGVASGLSHLNGADVTVVTNVGTILASPHNTAYDTVTVASGGFTIAGAGNITVRVGLPIVTDIQTLDIDAGATTIKDRSQFSGGLVAWVRDTGAFWAGPKEPVSATAVTELERMIPRDENWDEVTTLESGVVRGVTLATQNDNGRIFIRQVDPVPMTILALAPQGTFGGTR